LYLRAGARRLVESLPTRRTTLSGTRRQKNQSLAEFGIADVASFWLLYTINTYLPQFRHIYETKRGHPSDLYTTLLALAGALTTFSIANDVAKYFAILPALFITAYPGLQSLNIMNLASPASAILSAVIFNALVIFALIPLALRGVRYQPATAAQLLRRNLLIYGLGGLIVPFVGIKAIDMAVSALGLA
jgi:hypothetical protein